MYVPNSHTLEYVGLGLSQAADYGFAELKSAIAALQDGGVEVFLSMGVCDAVLYLGVPDVRRQCVCMHSEEGRF